MSEKIDKPYKIEKNQVNSTTHKDTTKGKIYPFSNNHGYQKKILKTMENKSKNIPLIISNIKSDSALKERSIKMRNIDHL